MNIPIVVVTFNRPSVLKRVLKSLEAIKYDNPVKLYISIDGEGPEDIYNIAENFNWKAGDKEIIRHKENLGLRKHIISCGDLALQHEGIIVLEDDLFVSPEFYDYIAQIHSSYKYENKLAGYSLYSHLFNETAQFAFHPLEDGNDVFFLQVASSWGQCWTNKHWSLFKTWYEKNSHIPLTSKTNIPPNVVDWPETSWKKYYIAYMIEKGLTFIYPRRSYSTNFGDTGVNHKGYGRFQVPIQYLRSTLKLPSYNNSLAKYDSYCEILPECLNSFNKKLKEYNYDVDLYGCKPLHSINSEYILTTRPCDFPVLSYGKAMVPHEANIISEILGNNISLVKTKNANQMELKFTPERMAYFHRLPEWHLRKKFDSKNKEIKISISPEQDYLLNIHSSKLGKILLAPVFAIYNCYDYIRKKLLKA